MTKGQWKRVSLWIPPLAPLVIHNVVGNFSFTIPFDLKTVAEVVCGKYDPYIFPTTTATSKDSATVYGLCSTGFCITTGSPSQEHTVLTAELLSSTFSRVYRQRVTYSEITFPNIVCCASLGHGLDLQAIRSTYPGKCIYEPSKFLGMDLTLEIGKGLLRQKVHFILFQEGQVNVAGIKDLLILPEIEQELRRCFRKFATTKVFYPDDRDELEPEDTLSSLLSLEEIVIKQEAFSLHHSS